MPIQLIHADCLKTIPNLESCSIDCVVTSPPYNLDIAYGEYSDSLPYDEYLKWVSEWGSALRRVLKDDGHFFLNVAGSLKKPHIPFDVLKTLVDDSGFVLQNTIHWIKSMAFPTDAGEIQRGHYKPVNSKRFLNSCAEYVFHLTKAGTSPLDRLAVGIQYADKSNVARFNRESDLKCRGNVWFIPYETINSRLTDRPHPATFPVELAKRCIKLAGLNPESVVLDPFAGLGSTALAARDCGVNFIGYDIDAGYIEASIKRLS